VKRNPRTRGRRESPTIPRPRIYVVIPVFNEFRNVEALLAAWRGLERKLPRYRFVYVIVDDGSTDGTAALARQCLKGRDGTVLSHEMNRGPGYAFGTAFEHLSTLIRPGDRVVTIEGDNTSRDELVPVMLERLEREGYDAVFASPYAYGGGIENTRTVRVILSHGANAFVKGILGIHGIHTMSSFFRVYRGEIIQTLQSRYGPRIVERSGFESMVELLKKLILIRARISEVPMELDTAKRAGASKMRILRTIKGYLTLYFSMRRWS
jgi:dolichol-phosphate mannosyltransferase